MPCSAPATFERDQPVRRRRRLLLDVALGVELLDVSPQVVDFLLVLDAGEDHFGAGDLGPGVLDVFFEVGLVPDDAGVLVGVGIAEVGHGAGHAAIETVEFRADLVLRAGTDAVTGQALLERVLALLHILRQSCRCRSGDQYGGYDQCPHCHISLSRLTGRGRGRSHGYVPFGFCASIGPVPASSLIALPDAIKGEKYCHRATNAMWRSQLRFKRMVKSSAK